MSTADIAAVSIPAGIIVILALGALFSRLARPPRRRR